MSDAVGSSFGLDDALAAKLREMGPVLDPAVVARSWALFADRIDLDMPAGGARHYDVAYGDDERQKLDVCATYGRGRAVVLFVPGGGVSGGDKSLYLHVPTYFAREGFVGVVMNHRSSPRHKSPDAARDVAAALDWISNHIGDCGGDPDKIFVLAQSVGAAHASAALFDPRLQPDCIGSVRAVVLMSGFYGVDPAMRAPEIEACLGEDIAAYHDSSLLETAAQTRIPVVVTVSELDPPILVTQSSALVERLRESGKPPLCLRLEGHNHLSPALGLGIPGDLLGKALAERFRHYL